VLALDAKEEAHSPSPSLVSTPILGGRSEASSGGSSRPNSPASSECAMAFGCGLWQCGFGCVGEWVSVNVLVNVSVCVWGGGGDGCVGGWASGCECECGCK